MSHVPVLLKEAIELLNPQPNDFIIDGTVGSGGHAVEILKRIGPKGKLLGIDWDKERIADCRLQIANFKNVILVHGNYADLPEILEEHNLGRANGLILDLGFSSEQLEKSGRGFSFGKDEPLDMRYDQREGMTAADIVNKFSEKDLAEIFWKYGEERYSRRIAAKIVEERKKKPIKTTAELVEIIKKSVPKSYDRGRIHPATRAFQALRICVNQELENLETLLRNIDKIVKNKPGSENSIDSPRANKIEEYRVSTTGKGRARLRQGFGGRVVIISFHSLEDRLVKNYFRELKKQGKAVILTKKPVTAGREEILSNPRSRSAKLRAIKIIE